jgi:hypothetical protein
MRASQQATRFEVAEVAPDGCDGHPEPMAQALGVDERFRPQQLQKPSLSLRHGQKRWLCAGHQPPLIASRRTRGCPGLKRCAGACVKGQLIESEHHMMGNTQ